MKRHDREVQKKRKGQNITINEQANMSETDDNVTGVNQDDIEEISNTREISDNNVARRVETPPTQIGETRQLSTMGCLFAMINQFQNQPRTDDEIDEIITEAKGKLESESNNELDQLKNLHKKQIDDLI